MDKSIINCLYKTQSKHKLASLIKKFLKNHITLEYIKDILKNNLTDIEYINIFRSYLPSSEKSLCSDKVNLIRGKNRLKDISELLNDISLNKSGNYLDLGCSDGIVTFVIGAGLGFEKKQIYATDIFDVDNNNINFTLCDEKELNFPDK